LYFFWRVSSVVLIQKFKLPCKRPSASVGAPEGSSFKFLHGLSYGRMFNIHEKVVNLKTIGSGAVVADCLKKDENSNPYWVACKIDSIACRKSPTHEKSFDIRVGILPLFGNDNVGNPIWCTDVEFTVFSRLVVHD